MREGGCDEEEGGYEGRDGEGCLRLRRVLNWRGMHKSEERRGWGGPGNAEAEARARSGLGEPWELALSNNAARV